MNNILKYVNNNTNEELLSSECIVFLPFLSQGSQIFINNKEYRVHHFSQIIDTKENKIELILYLNPEFIDQVFTKADFCDKDYVKSEYHVNRYLFPSGYDIVNYSHIEKVLTTLCELRSGFNHRSMLQEVEHIAMSYQVITALPPYHDYEKFNEFMVNGLVKLFNREIENGNIVRIK